MNHDDLLRLVTRSPADAVAEVRERALTTRILADEARGGRLNLSGLGPAAQGGTLGSMPKRADASPAGSALWHGSGRAMADAAQARAAEWYRSGRDLITDWYNRYPMVRMGTLGAAAGAGLGAILSLASNRRRRAWLSNLLAGALLGGSLGVAGGALMTKPPPASPDLEAATHPRVQEAIHKIRRSMQEIELVGSDLGVLVDPLFESVMVGQLTPGEAARHLSYSVPSMHHQLSYIPANVVDAMRSLRPGQALATMDVLGLKNITPFQPYFNPWLLGSTALVNLMTRHFTDPRYFDTGHYARSALARLDPKGRPLPAGVPDREFWSRLTPQQYGQLQQTFAPTGLLPPGTQSPTVTLSWTTQSGSKPPKTHTREISRDTLTGLGRAIEAEEGSLWRWGANPKAGLIRRSLRGLTGGPLPLMTSLAVPFGYEWLFGYRTAKPAFRDIVRAYQEVSEPPKQQQDLSIGSLLRGAEE